MTSQTEERSLDTLAESPDKRLTVRMTETEYAYIAELAAEIDCSVNRVIRHVLWTCDSVAGATRTTQRDLTTAD